MEQTDNSLVKACIRGERIAQKSLYERYKVAMYTLCLRYASCREEAEDFLHDGFLKIFKDLKQYDSKKGALYTWMRTVMVHTALSQLRKKNVLKHSEEVENHGSLLKYEPDIIDGMSYKELIETVNSLPEGYRMVFNLYAVEGYSHREIADMLEVSEGTSKSQYHRARKELMKRIKEKKIIIEHVSRVI